MATMTVSNQLANRYPGSTGQMGNASLAVGNYMDSPSPVERTGGVFALHIGGGTARLSGYGLTYDSSDELAGGVITGWDWALDSSLPLAPSPAPIFSITGLSIPATALSDLLHDPLLDRAPLVFAGDDIITGAVFGGLWSDWLFGYAGDDTISAAPADEAPGDGKNYLRGGEGNDVISGGGGFDDINGNQGNDTVHSGAGDDWVLGGKDDDLLYGEDGGDIVYGNLGSDTCDGGAGADTVRGGQGDDSLAGGDGNDWLSGDRGSDTLSGGAGADVFHSFGEAGVDRVTDFNRAEGDRVQLDPGTTYAVSQVGADVVIALSGGGQVVLAGVQLSTLGGDWVFTG